MLLSALAASDASSRELESWVAQELPALVLDQLDAPAVDLAGLRGRPVIVHFFATWCAPCIEEMASLDALAARPDVDVAILAVDVGEVDARVRNFFRERPVRFPILLDRDRAAMKRWGVTGLPTSFVLDRDLRPVLRVGEPVEWTATPVLKALGALAGKADEEATATKTSKGGMTR